MEQERERPEERKKGKKVNIAWLTGFPLLAGTQDALESRIAPLCGERPPPLSGFAGVRHAGVLPPLDCALSSLSILAAGRRSCFASVCKYKTFPGSSPGPLWQMKHKTQVSPGSPIAWLCFWTTARILSMLSTFPFYLYYIIYHLLL